mgnify:CR=1 FL=1
MIENHHDCEKPKNKNKLIGSLVTQVLKCDDIDDIFWKLYQSSDDEDKNKFVDEPAKINPATG